MPCLPLLASLALSGAAAASEPRLAVLNVEPRPGVSPELAKTISDLVVTQVRYYAVGRKVISTADIADLVAFQKSKEKLETSDTSALAKVGEDLGADEIITGSLAILGDSYVLTLRRLDVKRAQAIHEGSVTQPRGNDGWLSAAVLQLVGSLFPPDTPAQAVPPPSDLVELPPPPYVLPSAPAPVVGGEVATPGPPPHHSHWTSVVFMGIGVALLAAAVVGTVEVVDFGNLKGQSNSQNIPISQGETAQGNAIWGGVLAIVGYPLGATSVVGGALAW